MTTTKSRWATVHGVGVFALLGAATTPAHANPPAITIPECAQASTIRSTIDPKKKDDAKRKTEQAARLQQICTQKYNASRAQNQKPSPAPTARPTGGAEPRKSNGGGGLFGLFNVHTSSAPPPPNTRRNVPGNTYTVQLVPSMAGPAAPAPAAPPAPVAAPAPAATSSGAARAGVVPPLPPANTTGTSNGAPTPSTALTPEQLNVFGVQLYESLKLPACAQGTVELSDAHSYESAGNKAASSITAPCAEASAPAQPIAQRFAALDGVTLPRNVKFALVRLPANRCPSWMSASCTLGVVSQGGIVVGVSFLTDPARDTTVEQTITSKFGAGPTATGPATCDLASDALPPASKPALIDRTWSLSDLTVRYRPTNGLKCAQGRVLVDATPMKKLRDQHATAQATAEPKM